MIQGWNAPPASRRHSWCVPGRRAAAGVLARLPCVRALSALPLDRAGQRSDRGSGECWSGRHFRGAEGKSRPATLRTARVSHLRTTTNASSTCAATFEPRVRPFHPWCGLRKRPSQAVVDGRQASRSEPQARDRRDSEPARSPRVARDRPRHCRSTPKPLRHDERGPVPVVHQTCQRLLGGKRPLCEDVQLEVHPQVRLLTCQRLPGAELIADIVAKSTFAQPVQHITQRLRYTFGRMIFDKEILHHRQLGASCECRAFRALYIDL